jgi:hypothetical protein
VSIKTSGNCVGRCLLGYSQDTVQGQSSWTSALRQLGDAGGDAPGLVVSEQMRRRATPRLFLEIDVGERVPVSVPSSYDNLCVGEKGFSMVC